MGCDDSLKNNSFEVDIEVNSRKSYTVLVSRNGKDFVNNTEYLAYLLYMKQLYDIPVNSFLMSISGN